MPQPSQESTQPLSFVTAPSQPNSQSSKWSTTQIEPRAVAAAAALAAAQESTRPFTQTSSQLNPGSTTQIEPRAVAAAAALAAAQESTRPFTQTSSQLNPGSTTQIEPRVATIEAALASEREREAMTTNSEAPTTEKIAVHLTKALSSVPDARLVVASCRYPKDASKDSSIIRLPQTIKNRVTFGVIQQTKDVDLVMHLPLKRHSTSIELECQIIYDPGSDDCLLVNYTDPELRLVNFSSSPPNLVYVKEKSGHLIQPGMWRISAGGDEGGPDECHLAEFWLLKRQFSVSIRVAKTSPQAKRSADDDTEVNATKKQKLENDLTATRPAQSTNKPTIEPRPATTNAKSTHNHHLASTSPVREIANKTAVPILDLADGETAVVQTIRVRSSISQPASSAKDLARYQLQRIEHVGATNSTSVFACQHSAIRGPVVAKVLRHNRDSHNNFTKFASVWKREKTVLEKLKHRSIVSLEAFDGRMLAMYLEALPQTLFSGLKSTLQLSDAYTILHDISSALAYLAELSIIHNDIKPLNITYSPHRGAVLIDFGTATSSDDKLTGGSPWYIPPDLIREKVRGLPGDVWALGITMLYVLCKIEFPERIAKGWAIYDIYKSGVSRERMMDWLSFISSIRIGLNQEAKGNTRDEIESIVFKMLEIDGKLRMTAEDITLALDALDLNPINQVTEVTEDLESTR
ncbi:hypothetical protein ACHAQJ_006314 [Trichoderma viride]